MKNNLTVYNWNEMNFCYSCELLVHLIIFYFVLQRNSLILDMLHVNLCISSINFKTQKTTVYPIWFVASFKNDFYWQVTNFSQAQQFSSLLCILRHFAMHWREMVSVGDNWLKAGIISTAFIVWHTSIIWV